MGSTANNQYLQHKQAFEAVLSNYKISDEGRQVLAKLKAAFLVAPSSSGRNAIINELVKSGQYHFVISDTTRQPRQNDGVMERHGVEYFFRDEQGMLDDLRRGQFLEAAIIHNQQVSGISIRELKKAAEDKRIAIADIEIQGALRVHQAKPDGVFIFVLPPNFQEWMRRLAHRGQLDQDELKRRLESAEHEIQTALAQNFFHFVINDDFDLAVKTIDDLIRHPRPPVSSSQAVDIAWKILSQVKRMLRS